MSRQRLSDEQRHSAIDVVDRPFAEGPAVSRTVTTLPLLRCKESQPVAVREPNQPAGHHRRPTTLWSPLNLLWEDPVAARGLWRLASMVTPRPTPSYLGAFSIATKPAISGANCSASIRLKLATSDVTQSTTQRLPPPKKKAM
jgi:hypothetical protein